MNVEERRKEITNILKNSYEPASAKELAVKFHVSRQVIVQDMAVIRASTDGIISTYQGYVFQGSKCCSREFKVCHDDAAAQEELSVIVDCGGKVKNVSISHKIYGRITAELDIASQQDVKEFIEQINSGKSSLLGNATSGYHYHLVEAANTERLDLIEKKLDEAGILAPLSPWEIQSSKEKNI